MDEPVKPATDVTDPDHVWTARERRMIETGFADVKAGRVVDEAVVNAWFDAIERGEDPPVPQSGQP